ncbi:Lrp/AsnC family transcriptional regulator [Chelatococcus reniformis]|uniref:Transcriptional regulator n=1 Tax=Chelatococcus reniformis TaxID=1494448 RepID=A0A916U2D0_9HYPH|nr:Lrp/AsnC family transcriptional regulator [Chelatococcus reniformis]GGC54233.1 transcriptional regulator [Chelatococcus reniformis]
MTANTLERLKPGTADRSVKLDAIDRKILRGLQRDATVTIAALADDVGLSPTPCWKRIQRLEAVGVIRKRVALLDQDMLGIGITVFVSIQLGEHSEVEINRFAAAIGALPEVTGFFRMAGDIDYMAIVVVPDMAAYDDVYRRIIAAGNLKNVVARFALERLKSETAIPIP